MHIYISRLRRECLRVLKEAWEQDASSVYHRLGKIDGDCYICRLWARWVGPPFCCRPTIRPCCCCWYWCCCNCCCCCCCCCAPLTTACSTPACQLWMLISIQLWTQKVTKRKGSREERKRREWQRSLTDYYLCYLGDEDVVERFQASAAIFFF